jgi:hypothetical protein
MPEMIPCKTMFSNGTEFEYFIETQCEKCTRFRKGRCRIYNACHKARFDKKYFPFSELLDIEGYAGKRCKRFTDKPLQYGKKPIKNIDGQLSMETE